MLVQHLDAIEDPTGAVVSKGLDGVSVTKDLEMAFRSVGG